MNAQKVALNLMPVASPDATQVAACCGEGSGESSGGAFALRNNVKRLEARALPSPP